MGGMLRTSREVSFSTIIFLDVLPMPMFSIHTVFIFTPRIDPAMEATDATGII